MIVLLYTCLALFHCADGHVINNWTDDIVSGFLSPPPSSTLPTVTRKARQAVLLNVKNIIEGLGRKSDAALAHDSDEGNDEDDDSDDESVDSLYHDVAEEQPQRQIRPLVVSEINANYEIASSDCTHGAEPIQFTDRRIPADVAGNVSVTVKHGDPKRELPTCATINEVSRLFSFTEDQHRAFAIAGRSLLQYFSTEDNYFSMPDEELASMQRLVLIHGMGGTGKSHIFLGLHALALSWSRPDAIGGYCITGVAAINISGETIARLVFQFKLWGMTDALRKRYQSKRAMILDEVSMLKWGDLRAVDMFCRALNRRPNVPFGGMSIVGAGDFCQLPPVGGTYIFLRPGGTSDDSVNGFNLYRAITNDSVVLLNRVQRTDNEEFIELQRKVRLGVWDKATETAFRNREGAVLPPAPQKGNTEKNYIPFLVTKNITRYLLEQRKLLSMCAACSDDSLLPIVVFAHMRTRKTVAKLTPEEKTYLLGLPDNLLNKVPAWSAHYPGAWGMITTNLNVSCGLGQGTRGRELGWPEFPPGTTFTVKEFNGARVRIASADPICIFFEITSTDLRAVPEGQPKGLPPNVVALPMHDHRSAVVDLSKMPGTNQRKSVALKMKQLPMRPANALTTYSVQSSQFQRLVIFEATPSEFYTQVSRCQNGLTHISFARPLKTGFKPKARESTENEIARLMVEHSRTARNFRLETRSGSSKTTSGAAVASNRSTSKRKAPPLPPPAPPLLPPPTNHDLHKGAHADSQGQKRQHDDGNRTDAAKRASHCQYLKFLEDEEKHHRDFFKDTLHLPPAPGVHVIPSQFNRLQLRVRIVDFLYSPNCSSDWLARWCRSVGGEVSIVDSGKLQVGVECGFVAPLVERILHKAAGDFMSANTCSAVLWNSTCDQLQWLLARDVAGDIVFDTNITFVGRNSSVRQSNMTDAGLQTWFLDHEEVSHLLERHHHYPSLGHVIIRGVVGVRFYLSATKTVNDALIETVSSLIESILPDGAAICAPLRLTALPIYGGVISVSTRVQLNQRTVAELRHNLNVATLDLSPGEASVKPTHVRTSSILFARNFSPRPLDHAINPGDVVTDFPLIANRNKVQREIGQTMLDMSRGSVGDQSRRIAISNADTAGTGTHWFTVCFEVKVMREATAAEAAAQTQPSL